MRKVLLACVMVASLAGCSWWHRDRDRNMESSGSSTPPVSQAQSEPRSLQGTSSNGAALPALRPHLAAAADDVFVAR